jgi:acetyl-CoA C-acetyltransferase
MHDAIVIVAAARTPIGAFMGGLSAVPAPALGAAAIRGALARLDLGPQHVGEVLMGCVLTAGLGQAPARQAALQAGLPLQVPCTTIGKVCGSGMKAVMLAHDLLLAGTTDVVVAGGMESMSQAPHLLPASRHGLRTGHAQLLDHLYFDGLQESCDIGHKGLLMGQLAEVTAAEFGLSRGEQDAWAALSTARAVAAWQGGCFDAEVVPVPVSDRRARAGLSPVALFERDETPSGVHLDRIAQLKPAFGPAGTITAANASSLSDGAAALVLMRHSTALSLGCKPLARLLAHTSHAREPAQFTTAPVGAIEGVLAELAWEVDDVGLWEINEAFALVTQVAVQALGLDAERVNVHGGACALGHPIGATGARLLVTLLHAMRLKGERRGVASLCIGGGEATAVALELC